MFQKSISQVSLVRVRCLSSYNKDVRLHICIKSLTKLLLFISFTIYMVSEHSLLQVSSSVFIIDQTMPLSRSRLFVPCIIHHFLFVCQIETHEFPTISGLMLCCLTMTFRVNPPLCLKSHLPCEFLAYKSLIFSHQVRGECMGHVSGRFHTTLVVVPLSSQDLVFMHRLSFHPGKPPFSSFPLLRCNQVSLCFPFKQGLLQLQVCTHLLDVPLQ